MSRKKRSKSKEKGRKRKSGGNVKVVEVFEKVDKDGSGKINARELQEALSNGSWEPFSEALSMLFVGMFDRNGDGVLSLGEFKQLWSYLEQWTSTFRRFDADGSGRIGLSEFRNALSAFGYSLSPAFTAAIHRRFATSEHSKQLAFDQFVEAAVMLHTITESFKGRDHGRTGNCIYRYEDFAQDVIELVFRLQRNIPADAEDEDD